MNGHKCSGVTEVCRTCRRRTYIIPMEMMCVCVSDLIHSTIYDSRYKIQ